jgi:hypothetical protein
LCVSRFPFSKGITPLSDRDLFEAVARNTAEDSPEIACRVFVFKEAKARSAD